MRLRRDAGRGGLGWRQGGRADAGGRGRQPLDPRRRSGEGPAPLLPLPGQVPKLHRGPPGQKPADARPFGTPVPQVVTTSHLTHQPIERHLRQTANYGYPGPLFLSPGRSIGLRMVPMARDLRFAWEEMPQQVLDVQAQKVRESLHAALIAWAEAPAAAPTIPTTCPCSACTRWDTGSRSPTCCATARSGGMLAERPQLKYLLLHNIDTLGADLDPGLLGLHIASGGLPDASKSSRGGSKTGAAAWPASAAGCGCWRAWPCPARKTSSA